MAFFLFEGVGHVTYLLTPPKELKRTKNAQVPVYKIMGLACLLTGGKVDKMYAEKVQ